MSHAASIATARAPTGTRTQTEAILSRLPLPLGYGGVAGVAAGHATTLAGQPADFAAAGVFAAAFFAGAFFSGAAGATASGAAGRGRAANSSKT